MPTRILIILMVCFCIHTEIRANDQKLVVGLGGGGFIYFEEDDPRKDTGSDAVEDSERIDTLSMTHFFLEWYGWDSLGIGCQSLTTNKGFEYTVLGGSQTRKVMISNYLATAQWIMFGSSDYTRFGLVLGSGLSYYNYRYYCRADSGYTCDNVLQVWVSRGRANTRGVFLDWGGADFGARLGYNRLETSGYDAFREEGSGNTIRLENVDGSGHGFYFDLRWAF